MAEYFYRKQEAEDFIRKSSQGKPVLFARVRLLHGNEQWIVDYQRRDLGGSIEILENLNHEVDDIRKPPAIQTSAPVPAKEFKSCSSCGSTSAKFAAQYRLNIFRCSCGNTYCDNCSGGGLIDLPRCPVSPYHEDMQKIGFVLTRTKQESETQPAPTSSAVHGKKALQHAGDYKIRFKCPKCAKPVSAPKEFAGKQGKCPACGTSTRIPGSTFQNSRPAPRETGESKRSPQPASKAPPRADARAMKTKNPSDAARVLFEDTLACAPQLSESEIESHLHDWSGDANLKPIYGSRQELEAMVLPYFESYLHQPRFEEFDIDYNPRWRCAFVKVFYSGRSGLLLLWNGPKGLAVTATGEFPVSSSNVSPGHASNIIRLGKLEVMNRDLGKMSWTDATKACQALGGGWRLPTRDELTTLYENRESIGGFSADKYGLYWSSTRIYATSAWVRVFANGDGVEDSHTGEAHVRTVRTI